MRRLIRYSVTAIVCLAAPHVDAQQSQPELGVESLLVVGKAAGACGILDLQMQFQQSTKLDGGDAFIVRFWTTEAARLGMSLQGYVEHCARTLSSYGRLQETARQIDTGK